jgi:DNA processing protein
MDRDELAAWLRLVLTPQVGNTHARRLLAAFGLPQRIFEASPSALAEVVPPVQAKALRTTPAPLHALIDVTTRWLADAPDERRVITLGDSDYPAGLLQTEDPPLMLYAMGASLAAGHPLAWPEAIAVVGSRNPTPQGAANARQFALTFAQAGWTVVSGLALGVDAAAHEGALEGAPTAGPATIAVVGTGLDRVYPRQHRELAHRIATRGLLLSEYPLGTPPLAENFPRRNRIISGLSRGTLVVEAALQSGSLITARMAAEQGRDVFAIPGSIHSPQARGCHALIKQGAKLVETAQDVLEELAPGQPPALPAEPAEPAEPADSRPLPTSAAAGVVLKACGFDPVSFDALQARTGLATPALQALLLELELQGVVARMPGGLFQRSGSA